MSDACVLAIGAISAIGVGRDGYALGGAGEGARVFLSRDEELARAGLLKPNAARAPRCDGDAAFADPATALLANALEQVIRALDEVRPHWRSERIGLSLGTSSGGMVSAERFFALRSDAASQQDPALARRSTYFAPQDDALCAVGLSSSTFKRQTHLVSACAASTIAIGLGLRWLDRGVCDLVLAGGYDAVSTFVAMGFEALRATTTTRPRPFRIGRDGMSLGEGAALVALVREADTQGARVFFRISGFGASTDAVHITAPDRTGKGLARAGLSAIADSGLLPSNIQLVSAHATATPFNDAMESRAIATIFADAPRPVVHPLKAQIGHTLGAAGVLESLAAADALATQVAPAAAGEGDLDPDADVLLLERSEPRSLSAALKLSAAFGGANASLVLSAQPTARRARAPRKVYLRGFVRVESTDIESLSALLGIARDRLARLDTLCRLGLRAVGELALRVGKDKLQGGGIVAGHALATLDTNDRFDARRRTKGPTAVDPRLFPLTSPNAVAGECAIAFQLTGPSFAVNASLDGGSEALACAAELVAMGDSDAMVVLAADDAGPAARALLAWTGQGDRAFADGAVALLVTASQADALGEVDLGALLPLGTGAIGHLALAERVEKFLAR